jgi:hypothetical protein
LNSSENNKFKKYNEKAKAIEEQKNFILKELDKKKKLNLFRYLDQKENFNRERTFYKKFTDKILNKHQHISQTIDREKEK